MISSSYIWSWHIWFSYDQPFLYLRSYVCVPIFIHGINGLPISVHRIIGFLMNSLPIIAFLYLRSYDCVFLYPCLPVERGGSAQSTPGYLPRFGGLLDFKFRILNFKLFIQHHRILRIFYFKSIPPNNHACFCGFYSKWNRNHAGFSPALTKYE